MQNYKKCPVCKHLNENNPTYCNKCGLNIDKYYSEQLTAKETENTKESNKKGSFEKNFFRGKK